MANNENLIPIPGRLHSVATEGHVAGADEIYDDTLQKDQATINSEVNTALGTGGTVDSRIAAAKAEIIGDASSDYNTLGKVEDKVEDIADNVAYIDDSESSPAVVPSFDPESQTVHVTAQTLSEQQKAQVRENIGLGDVDAKINEAVASEASQRAAAVSGVQNSVNAESSRAQTAEADRYTKSETYTKEEVHNLITTPNQEYVSVTATDQTTDVTDVLPATGEADTIYRVGNWDGTQYNESEFSEYAWNGSAYIKLSTKPQVGEVYDISANHADTKYSDLAAALGTNGANIPQSLQKGGMSVKFVQSSDNKYVQYRLTADDWSTNTKDWAIAEEGVYVENPEFIYVKTDKDDKILLAIKADGSIYYGAGVPKQVIDYISSKFEELSIDEIKTSIPKLIDNFEWIDVITDAESKILEGITSDGKKILQLDTIIKGNLSVKTINIDKEGINNLKEDIGLIYPDKYVLWLGTSIPQGCTYPIESCKANGYTCIKKAVGSSSLCFVNEHPSQVKYYSGRELTATVAELEALYRNDVISGVITEENLEEWKNGSYERSVIPYIDGTEEHQVSMIVIDHGYNDRSKIQNQLLDEENINWNSEDRSNFTGAFRYLINRIQEINPFVKIVIAGYFTNSVHAVVNEPGGQYFHNNVLGNKICKMQCLIAENYNISIMRAWEHTQISNYYVSGTSLYIDNFNLEFGTSYERLLLEDESGNVIGEDNGNVSSFQLYCLDGIHPHTDLTKNSDKRLNAVYAKLLSKLI